MTDTELDSAPHEPEPVVAQAPAEPRPTAGTSTRQPRIPRWRGFNLTEMVNAEQARPFLESDFAWLTELGFDFARLPLSYRCWFDAERPEQADEGVLGAIDQAIDWGRKYGIHVNLCLHRIPGYCINARQLEPCDLFQGPAAEQARALEAACQQWRLLAERYRGISTEQLSFDLLNEPPWMDDQTRYVQVVHTLVAEIREVDPDRLIVVDGADLGQSPLLQLARLGVVQSTRGYLPKALSHYTATWVPEGEFESFRPPTWPLIDDQGRVYNRQLLHQKFILPWRPLVEQGAPVHVGEWGCFNRTPHPVALGWMQDLLSLWKEAGWGWAMWNFRGAFGILDSQRADVAYEDFHGHRLDRKMLELLLAY